VIGIDYQVCPNSVLCISLATEKNFLVITFGGKGSNKGLADMLSSQFRKVGVHLERLAGVLKAWYNYELNKFLRAQSCL